MTLIWLLRRAVKRLVIWAGLGPVLIEYCKECGRRQRLVWHASGCLWLEVNGKEGGVLCPECFDRLAAEQGYLLTWTPSVHRTEAEAKDQPNAEPEK